MCKSTQVPIQATKAEVKVDEDNSTIVPEHPHAHHDQCGWARLDHLRCGGLVALLGTYEGEEETQAAVARDGADQHFKVCS